MFNLSLLLYVIGIVFCMKFQYIFGCFLMRSSKVFTGFNLISSINSCKLESKAMELHNFCVKKLQTHTHACTFSNFRCRKQICMRDFSFIFYKYNSLNSLVRRKCKCNVCISASCSCRTQCRTQSTLKIATFLLQRPLYFLLDTEITLKKICSYKQNKKS